MSDVNVKVSADTSEASTGLAKLQNAVHSFQHEATHSFKEIGGMMLGAFALEKVIEFFKGVAEEMDRVEKLSMRFGESAESIQRIGVAAKLAGGDIETVAKAMMKANANGLGAVGGSKELAEAFATLGIDAKEFVDMPMEEKLMKLAEGYEEGESQALKMDAVMKILGKSGAELIPLLAEGPESLKKIFKETSVASDETVSRLAKALDAVEYAWMQVKSGAASTLGFILDACDKIGVELAAMIQFIANIPNGLQAAKDAYHNTTLGYLENLDEEKNKRKEEQTRRKGTAEEVEKRKEEAEAATEAEKADEEYHKKYEANRIAELSLMQRQLEIKERLAELDREKANATNKGDWFKAANEELELQKELRENKEKTKKAEEEKERKEKAADKKAVETQYKRTGDMIKNKEAQLDWFEKPFKSVKFDSLREIGGSMAGVNYNVGPDDQTKKQIDLLKQQLKELKDANDFWKKQLGSTLDNGGVE